MRGQQEKLKLKGVGSVSLYTRRRDGGHRWGHAPKVNFRVTAWGLQDPVSEPLAGELEDIDMAIVLVPRKGTSPTPDQIQAALEALMEGGG
jgi:hypothetical protein